MLRVSGSVSVADEDGDGFRRLLQREVVSVEGADSDAGSGVGVGCGDVCEEVG